LFGKANAEDKGVTKNENTFCARWRLAHPSQMRRRKEIDTIAIAYAKEGCAIRFIDGVTSGSSLKGYANHWLRCKDAYAYFGQYKS
jgi:hypothetical protein